MRVSPTSTPSPRFTGNFFFLGRDIALVRKACDDQAATNTVAVVAYLKEDGREETYADGSTRAKPIVSGYVLTGFSALNFLERLRIRINPNQATADKVRADIHTELRTRYGPGYMANDEFFRLVQSESMRLDRAQGTDEYDAKVARDMTRL